MIELTRLNAVPPAVFVEHLTGIFEHSPWVAERAAAMRPFDSRVQLLDSLRDVVHDATVDQQLALIRAHPKLGVRIENRRELTQVSAREQNRAGLWACSTAELARLDELNEAYAIKFEMPFVLAVRGHDPASIIEACEVRLTQSTLLERRTALHEIGLIAGYRLSDAVATPAGDEIVAMAEKLTATSCAAAPALAALDLAREWMFALDLEVSNRGGEMVMGIRRGESTGGPVQFGEHAIAADGDAPSERPNGWLVGLEVIRQLRHRGIRLPFDLTVLAGPTDPGDPVIRSLGASRRARLLDQTVQNWLNSLTTT